MDTQRTSRPKSRHHHHHHHRRSTSSLSSSPEATRVAHGSPPRKHKHKKHHHHKHHRRHREHRVRGWGGNDYPNLVSEASMESSISDADMPLPADIKAFCASGLGIFPREHKEEPQPSAAAIQPPLSSPPPPLPLPPPSSDSLPSSPVSQLSLDLALTTTTTTTQLTTATTTTTPTTTTKTTSTAHKTNLTASSPLSTTTTTPTTTTTASSVENLPSDISNTTIDSSRIENISTPTTIAFSRFKCSTDQQRSKSDNELETDLQQQRKKIAAGEIYQRRSQSNYETVEEQRNAAKKTAKAAKKKAKEERKLRLSSTSEEVPKVAPKRKQEPEPTVNKSIGMASGDGPKPAKMPDMKQEPAFAGADGPTTSKNAMKAAVLKKEEPPVQGGRIGAVTNGNAQMARMAPFAEQKKRANEKMELEKDPTYQPPVKGPSMRSRAKSMYLPNPNELTVEKEMPKKPMPPRRRSVHSSLLPDDIKDPFYLRPYQYGWIREVVQHKSGNGADVVYISPAGKRMRNRNEIAKTGLPSDLSVENFCFKPQLQGVGEPREVFRHAKNNDDRRKSMSMVKQMKEYNEREQKQKTQQQQQLQQQQLQQQQPQRQQQLQQRQLQQQQLQQQQQKSQPQQQQQVAQNQAMAKPNKQEEKPLKQHKHPKPQSQKQAKPQANANITNIAPRQLVPDNTFGAALMQPALAKRVPKPKAPKGASPPPEGWTSTMAVKGNSRSLAQSNANSNSGAGSSAGNNTRKRSSNANKSGKIAAPETPTAVQPKVQMQLQPKAQPTAVPPKVTPQPVQPKVVTPQPVVQPEPEPEPEMEPPVEKRCYCCATLITDANKCFTASIKKHYCRDCMYRAIADHTMKTLASNNTQHINQDIEHPSALPPAMLLRDDSPARPGGGQITPKPLEVVVVKGRKAVAYCGPDLKGAQIKIVSDESTLNMFAKLYSKRNATAKEKRQQLTDCISAGSMGCQIMMAIMKTLDLHERVRLSSVCKTWSMIGRDRSVWRTVKLRNTHIKDWSLLLHDMVRHCTNELDMMGAILDNPQMLMQGDLAELKSLRILRTDASESEFIEAIIKDMPQLQELRTTCNSATALNLCNIEKMHGLRVLRIRMLDAKASIVSMPQLQNLSCLRELSLRGVTNMDQLDLLQLKDLQQLETLVLGSCRGIEVAPFGTQVLPSLKRLRNLRLENHHSNGTFNIKEIMEGIAAVGSVQRLELINVNIDEELSRQLSECKSLQELLLLPDFHNNSAYVVHYIMQAINENSEQLNVFCLGITYELLSVTRALAMINEKDIIPVWLPIPGVPDNDILNESECGIGYLPVERLESILHHMMPQAWLTVAKVSQIETINMKFLPAPSPRKDKGGGFTHI